METIKTGGHVATIGKDPPQYDHDCDHCVFLGRHSPPDASPWGGKVYPGGFDLYACPNGDRGSVHAVIARYGGDINAYKSGLFDLLDPPGHPIVEAMDRAEALGYSPRSSREYHAPRKEVTREDVARRWPPKKETDNGGK
jgi:hypothetical protein